MYSARPRRVRIASSEAMPGEQLLPARLAPGDPAEVERAEAERENKSFRESNYIL